MAEPALLKSEARKRAENAWKLTRLAIDKAADRVFWARQDGRLFYVNDSTCRSLGYSRKELLTMSIGDIVPDYQAATWAEQWRELKEKGFSTFETRHRAKDGRIFPVEVSHNYLQFDGYEYVCAFARDITHRLQPDVQLQQAQKMEAVGQLTSGIAHDFNNLLTIIIGNLQILEEDLRQNEKLSEPIKAALEAGVRGADLTRRLLAFSRQQMLVPKVMNINKLVSGIEPLLKTTLGAHINLCAKLAGDLWPTKVDPGQLENAVINLGVNARDAMVKGGKLTIETSNVSLDQAYVSQEPGLATGDYVLLRVSDNGTGIPKDTLLRVFEPFFSTKGPGKGSGLGLSMVYGFVKQSNGHIKIYSEEGYGTSIRIYLPRSESAAEDTKATPIRTVQVSRGQETILVVEDEEAVRRIAVKILGELGYRLLEAASGSAALPILEKHENIDLLFTDVVMPGAMTGAQLAKRARKRNPNLNVLFTSGYSETGIFDHGVLQGSDDILHKPYKKEELAQKVRDVLDRA
ncbi:MAG: response regulator, partial [Woeseia sp.]